MKPLEELQGKRILVTGGTGSFGNEFVKSLVSDNSDKIDCEIIVFSRDEAKQFFMRNAFFEDKRLRFVVGDIKDKSSIDIACKGVDCVFHAAALKQVPSCEFFPWEAVRTNIEGTKNVIDSIFARSVKRAVFLSTDKAVYPVNAMGLTKALMEKLVTAASRESDGRSVLSLTRYGNVLGSRGSVIPFFMEKINAGRPLTITDPRMTRFLMKLEEAIDLVLYAMCEAQNGQILVRKSSAASLAAISEAFKILFDDIQIDIVGRRNGEKLHETLVSTEEIPRTIDNGEYFSIQAENQELDYGRYFSRGEIYSSSLEPYASNTTTMLAAKEVVELIKHVKVKGA
jgi:UDP-N-acetylglucosamine 4,6-dehydratase